MKRSFALTATLVLFVLALAFSSSHTSPTAKAKQTDACDECQAAVQAQLDACEAQNGGPSQFCYDQFNQGIVHCYATVCEQ